MTCFLLIVLTALFEFPLPLVYVVVSIHFSLETVLTVLKIIAVSLSIVSLLVKIKGEMKRND